MKHILHIIVLLFIWSCENKPNSKNEPLAGKDLFRTILDTIRTSNISNETLINSNWVFTPFEDCNSLMTFLTDSTGMENDCEQRSISHFRYRIENDNLYLEMFEKVTEDNPNNLLMKYREDHFVYNGASLIMIDSKIMHPKGSFASNIKNVISYKKILKQ